ncbi:rRNA (cytosine-C(5))-methyltransferase NOP2C isoform X2 [Aristolochia californica]|uniref:rRNA (cytosine-C(5))-methyltransferase NOP2C isoform X2 n=1 Tax=Aristolochia californica TaxID=171875 RepID=UPI0035D9EB3A
MAHSERRCYKPSLRWNARVEEYFVTAYGAEHFYEISEALTRPSTYSCIRVNTLKATTDSVIEKLTSILHEAKLSSCVHGMNVSKGNGTSVVASDEKQEEKIEERQLELLGENNCGPCLGLFRHGAASLVYKCPMPGLDNVVFVKGSGPHKIEYSDAPKQLFKEVIVSRKCAEAVLRGAQIFVPGALACSAHVEKGDTVAVSVAVEQPNSDGGRNFGFTRGTVLQGLETDPQYHERRGMYIGQGTTMMSRAGIFRESSGVAVEMTKRVFELPSFNDVLEGEIFLQNLPSIVTARVLDPQRGERILDMCAAPGGKTTAIAILMKDEGEVIAVDRSHNKVLDIQNLAAEMGLTCIRAYKLDALKAVSRANDSTGSNLSSHKIESLDANVEVSALLHSPKDTDHSPTMEVCNHDTQCTKNGAKCRKNARRMKNGPGRNHSIGGRVESSKGFYPNSFDRVLLDAPCSALGLRPRLFAGEETVESLRNHVKYQRKMFDQAVQLVRPGGVLVYSTCTINPGENEALVRYALDTYGFLALASQHPRIGGPGLVGKCNLSDENFVEEWLRHGEEEFVQRFDPSSPLDTIGFFIAKFSVGMNKA